MMPGIELSSALSDNNNLINLRRRSKSDLFAIGFRDNIDFINKVYENIEDKNSSYIIRNAIFSGLVSRFDNILSKTIDIIIKLKPEVLKKSEISIGLFDISGEESFSSLKLKLITDFISGILLKSRNEQIKWIEDSLGIQIKSNIKVWDRFIEICERRNVYIHHDSIATQRYVEKLNSFKIEEAKDIKSGGVLTHGREYVFYSSDILYEVAIAIVQSVSRSVMFDDKECLAMLDSIVSEAVFNQNINKRYKSASRIADYANKNIKLTVDKSKKMLAINYATSKLLMNDVNHARKIVESVDWSASTLDFQICVDAILQKYDSVIEKMPTVARQDLIDLDGFMKWPVFKLARDRKDYWDALEATFKGSKIDIPDKFHMNGAVEGLAVQ